MDEVYRSEFGIYVGGGSYTLRWQESRALNEDQTECEEVTRRKDFQDKQAMLTFLGSILPAVDAAAAQPSPCPAQ